MKRTRLGFWERTRLPESREHLTTHLPPLKRICLPYSLPGPSSQGRFLLALSCPYLKFHERLKWCSFATKKLHPHFFLFKTLSPLCCPGHHPPPRGPALTAGIPLSLHPRGRDRVQLQLDLTEPPEVHLWIRTNGIRRSLGNRATISPWMLSPRWPHADHQGGRE